MRFNVIDDFDVMELRELLEEGIFGSLPNFNEIDSLIFFNAGSSRIPFDSFGPVFGSIINEKINSYNLELMDFIKIFGTVENNCNGLNMNDKIAEYLEYTSNKKTFTVSIDAAISDNFLDLGDLVVREYGISPAKGVGRDFPEIGNLSLTLTSIIAEDLVASTFNKFQLSKNRISNIVYILSDIIIDILLKKYQYDKSLILV